MDQVAALRRKCELETSKDHTKSGGICEKTMDYIDEVAGDVFTYDARIFANDWAPYKKAYVDFLTVSGQVQEIYKSIHIDQSTKVPVFESNSKSVADAYDNELMDDYSYYYDWLISTEGKHTLIYAGEWDQRDGPTTHETWMTTMPHLPKDFFTQEKLIYYID